MISDLKKAVILAGGLGTRFLPITKTFPKEMLPLIDKSVIQYLIEEVSSSGIKEIILIISPEKKIIKNYFEKNKKLEYFLKVRRENKILAEIEKIRKLPKIHYLYQKKPLGIGDAILVAKKKIKNEPFALLFADDVVVGSRPCLKQLIDLYHKYRSTIIGVSRVPQKEVFRYGIVKIRKISSRVYKVLDLIEKPKIREVRPWSDSDFGRSPSNLAIVGRYILVPPIFKILEKLKSKKLKAGEEIYLTDAISILLKKNLPVYACEYKGEWLSCGNKIGWLLANLKIGLQHPETKKDLGKYLTTKLKS